MEVSCIPKAASHATSCWFPILLNMVHHFPDMVCSIQYIYIYTWYYRYNIIIKIYIYIYIYYLYYYYYLYVIYILCENMAYKSHLFPSKRDLHHPPAPELGLLWRGGHLGTATAHQAERRCSSAPLITRNHQKPPENPGRFFPRFSLGWLARKA